jgi:hypothetical protein
MKADLETLDEPESEFQLVVLCSRHMIDQPSRTTPRFPPEKEGIVRDKMAVQLKEWG